MKDELFKKALQKCPSPKVKYLPIFICTAKFSIVLCGSGFIYIAKAKPFILPATHKVFWPSNDPISL